MRARRQHLYVYVCVNVFKTVLSIQVFPTHFNSLTHDSTRPTYNTIRGRIYYYSSKFQWMYKCYDKYTSFVVRAMWNKFFFFFNIYFSSFFYLFYFFLVLCVRFIVEENSHRGISDDSNDFKAPHIR